MTINLRAVVAAAALLSTAPASAALFTYDFTAGGQGVYNQGQVDTYSCDFGYCTNSSVQETETFSLSGSFTVDTSKLPADTFGGPDGLSYDTYPNQDPAVQFLSGTMTKTGGSLSAGTGTGGARSYLYGYDAQVGGGGSFMQAYAQAPGSTSGWTYEYHDNGNVARQYYREDYILFYVYNSLPEIGSLDGHDFATTFAAVIGEGYAQMGFTMYEYLYDQFGNQTDYTQTSSYAQARLTTLNAAPGGPSQVPEPAMLGLFGLGLAGVAMARRRKV